MRSPASVNHRALHEHDVLLVFFVPVITVPAEFLIARHERVSGRRLTKMQAVVADDQPQVRRDGAAVVAVPPSRFVLDGRMMPLPVDAQADVVRKIEGIEAVEQLVRTQKLELGSIAPVVVDERLGARVCVLECDRPVSEPFVNLLGGEPDCPVRKGIIHLTGCGAGGTKGGDGERTEQGLWIAGHQ